MVRTHPIMCNVITLYVQCLQRVWLPNRESPTVGSWLWCYTKYCLVLQNCPLLPALCTAVCQFYTTFDREASSSTATCHGHCEWTEWQRHSILHIFSFLCVWTKECCNTCSIWLTTESGRENFCAFLMRLEGWQSWCLFLTTLYVFVSFPIALKQKIMLRDRC